MEIVNASQPPRPTDHTSGLARNTFWLATGEFSSRIVGLAVAIYLARVLGATGYGHIGNAFALISYFTIFVAAGVDFHGVRDVAQTPDNVAVIVGRAVAVRLILVFISVFVIAVLIHLLPDKFLGRLDLLLIYALTLFTFALNTAWALRGLQEMRVIAVGLTFQNVLMALGIFAFVRGPAPQIWLVPVIQVTSEVLLIAFYYRFLQARFGRVYPVFSIRSLFATLKESLHLGIGRMPRVFYYQGDMLLLSWLATVASAGEFLASQKIILSELTVAIIFLMNTYPLTSRLAAADPLKAQYFQMDVLRYVFVCTLPFIVLGAVYSAPLITLVYSNSFEGAAPLFLWMSFTVPIFSACLAFQDLLAAMKKNNAIVSAGMIATVVHIAAAVIMIPRYGALGTAFASLLGQTVGLVLLSVFVRRTTGRFPFNLRTLGPIAGGAAMYAVIVMSSEQQTTFQVALSLLSYCAVLAVTRTFKADELTYIWQCIRKLTRMEKRQ